MRVVRFSPIWAALLVFVVGNDVAMAQQEPLQTTMKRPITFEFLGSPLPDVVEFWRDFTGLNFVIDARELRALKIGWNVRVSSVAKNQPVQQAIEQTLSQLGLALAIEDEVLVITSPKEATAIEKRAVAPTKPANTNVEMALNGLVSITVDKAALSTPLESLLAELKLTAEIDETAKEKTRGHVDIFFLNDVRAATGLKYLLRQQDLTYVIRGDALVITPIEDKPAK